MTDFSIWLIFLEDQRISPSFKFGQVGSWRYLEIMQISSERSKGEKVKFIFVCYIYVSIIKMNIISKFTLDTNDVMYVPIVPDSIRDVQQSETKKVNIKSNKSKSTMIILLTEHIPSVYIVLSEKYKDLIWFCRLKIW